MLYTKKYNVEIQKIKIRNKSVDFTKSELHAIFGFKFVFRMLSHNFNGQTTRNSGVELGHCIDLTKLWHLPRWNTMDFVRLAP
jgi:hypothetical protein